MGSSKNLIYFKDGKLEYEFGDTRIYSMKGHLYEEIGESHNLCASTMDLPNYIWVLSDKPKGNCLEIGLGLGTSSKYILSCPKVTSLTTIEVNQNVIDAYKYITPEVDLRHTIHNCNGLAYCYETRKKFDFVFLDFYTTLDSETLPAIIDMARGAARVMHSDSEIIGWHEEAVEADENIMNRFFDVFKTIREMI